MAHAARNTQVDTEEEIQILDSIERWVARELKPIVREYDHADRYPMEVVEQMKELGLFGAVISPEYGGLGLSAATYAKIVMSISSVWMSITGIINSHLMLALAIQKFGTPQQKTRWLPKLVDRRDPRRSRPDRARRRHRPAGHSHDRAARRRPLRHQRHQDVDHQRRRRLVLRHAGQDRSRCQAAL